MLSKHTFYSKGMHREIAYDPWWWVAGRKQDSHKWELIRVDIHDRCKDLLRRTLQKLDSL
jgi:hypothetical protein